MESTKLFRYRMAAAIEILDGKAKDEFEGKLIVSAQLLSESLNAYLQLFAEMAKAVDQAREQIDIPR